MTLTTAKYVSARKVFSDLNIDNILHNWGACLKAHVSNKKRNVFCCSPPIRVLKFKVDAAARGTLGLAGIGGVLRNHKGEVLHIFSEHSDSNSRSLGYTRSSSHLQQVISAVSHISNSYQHCLLGDFHYKPMEDAVLLQ